MPELMGPPAPKKYKTEEPGRPEEPEKDGLSKALMAMYAAQAADMMSTNDLLSYNGQKPPGWTPERMQEQGIGGVTPARSWEGNPLPGMQSETGRMLWGMGEAEAVKALSKDHKTLGKVLPIVLAVVHGSLAAHNWAGANAFKHELSDASYETARRRTSK